jgi:hypothetical protein
MGEKGWPQSLEGVEMSAIKVVFSGASTGERKMRKPSSISEVS